ncbi:hypothetical protein GGR56DRAFT_612261 [Xylariaceae sp. FL0804]|nr:hypothetical protein GGR56DRAFT_612261 [Xylariaceae sp. FL0804]
MYFAAPSRHVLVNYLISDRDYPGRSKPCRAYSEAIVLLESLSFSWYSFFPTPRPVCVTHKSLITMQNPVDDEPPPSYTYRAGETTWCDESDSRWPPVDACKNNNLSSSSRIASLPTQQSNVGRLPNLIWSTQETRAARQSVQDSLILQSLRPVVDDFLDMVATRPDVPPLAKLFLVPESAIPENAVLGSSDGVRREDEVYEVARVRVDLEPDTKPDTKELACDPWGAGDGESSGEDDRDWKTGQEFSDWGRFGAYSSSTDDSQSNKALWWQDEEMACRLSHHLLPPVAPLLPSSREGYSPAWNGRRVWTLRARDGERSPTSTTLGADEKNSPVRQRVSRQVRTSVLAENVAFRVQNAFGLLDSTSGWAVVVAVVVTPT